MNNIMLEEVSKAIGARLFVQFVYSGQTYLVEPHLIGQNQRKQDCLCGWSADKKDLPEYRVGWHCFLLDDIKDLKVTDKRFFKTRPEYDPYDSNMSRIYYRA
ncbi:hypothetical protein H8S95_18245 [Pontibacter sp. KCTC 32443]|uniref:hypothetical protein n=1 Tax=Pontibacter TaxID=323449 RepID=UPI00164E2318|nr:MULTISPECIES: hypothetical protein [Pontibacter]MBC5776023.1 hypothetical protein [Pontibacter sp. KCTC 32443]